MLYNEMAKALAKAQGVALSPAGRFAQCNSEISFYEGSEVAQWVNDARTHPQTSAIYDQATRSLNHCLSDLTAGSNPTQALKDALEAAPTFKTDVLKSLATSLQGEQRLVPVVNSKPICEMRADFPNKVSQAGQDGLLNKLRQAHTGMTFVKGHVTEIDARKERFILHEDETARSIKGPFDAERYLTELSQALTYDLATYPRVAVWANVVRDSETAGNKWDSTPNLLAFVPDYPTDQLVNRIRTISKLQSGWDEGRGAKLLTRPLVVSTLLAVKTTRAGLPLPNVCPLPDGGVLLGWQSRQTRISAEIASDELEVACSYLDVATHEQEYQVREYLTEGRGSR